MNSQRSISIQHSDQQPPRYTVEVRRALARGGWQWEVWVADELTMVAQGWANTKTRALKLGRQCRANYHALQD